MVVVWFAGYCLIEGLYGLKVDLKGRVGKSIDES